MLSWRNYREGGRLIRASTCGRFVVTRLEQQKNGLWTYRYELEDLQTGKTEERRTLQEVRHLADKLAGVKT